MASGGQNNLMATDKVIKNLLRWSLSRPPVSESVIVAEDAFLWGCQTAQRLAGIPVDSPNFIVDVGIALNRRWTKIEGWRIHTKDGRSRLLNPKAPSRRN